MAAPSNISSYGPYLRRSQIYRAMALNPTQTDVGLVLKKRGPPYRDVDLDDDFLPTEIGQRELDALQYLRDTSNLDTTGWSQRFDGVTNGDAMLNGFTSLGIAVGQDSGVGDKNSSARSQWWPIMSGIQKLLDDLHNSIARTDVNPPATYDIIAQTFAGTDEETGAVSSLTTTVAEQSTLYLRVQDILNRFRSVVYAPSSQSSDIRSRYFDVAFASTPTKSRTVLVNNIYSQNETRFKGLARILATRPQPNYFTFNDSSDTYSNQAKFVATRLILRLCALHNALFGSHFAPFGTQIKEVYIHRGVATAMLANCRAGLQILLDDIQNWTDVISPQIQKEREELRDEIQASNLDETGFVLGSLRQDQIDVISNNSAYNQLFSTTFNRGVITAVPIIHNLYLTTEFFPEVDGVFVGPKRKVLDLLESTIAGDNQFPTEPNLTRPAAEAAIANANGLPPDQFGLDAGKFILKMLVETPINILKGLVELIDPHVAITKLIKTGSAAGFRQASKTLDPFAATIKNRLEDELGVEADLTGKSLMTLLLCLVDYSYEQLDSGLAGVLTDSNIPVPGNFFPDVSMKGVDFTGTVSGMLMVPPTPLGLLYLLLELVKSEIDNITVNVDDAAATNAEENEC